MGFMDYLICITYYLVVGRRCERMQISGRAGHSLLHGLIVTPKTDILELNNYAFNSSNDCESYPECNYLLHFLRSSIYLFDGDVKL